MSKTKTLFTMALLVLLGSMGAVQAQDGDDNYVVIEMATQPNPAARMGGVNEMSGSIWLTFSTSAAGGEVIVTLKYSVPLAEAITLDNSDMFTSVMADVMGTPENADNDGNGTVVISGLEGDMVTTLVIRNVMLDVSSASGPVTVAAEVTSSDVNDFIRIEGPNIGTVISDIVVGVKVTPTARTVRTRGTDGGATATLTLEEAYTDAFMMGDELEIKFSGIPDDATLEAKVTGIKMADPDAVDVDGDADPVVTTNMDAYATVSSVSPSGSATVMLGGNDMTENSMMRVAPDKVVLNLTLTAKGPLDVGDVTAEVTFAGDYFTKVFTDAASVFKIRPAQCELLFPVVSVLPMSSLGPWDTAISVTNPAYTDEMADGGLTFTFYAQTDNMGNIPEPEKFTTSPDGPGTGLSLDGTLAAGSTYQVLASQILGYTEWGSRFVGHVHLLADYTNCSGLGWVTNFFGEVSGGINQAYTATVIDADTGTN